MAKKKHKKDSDADLPVIMDYGIGCISIYDPVDMMPYNDPPVTEQTRFKKLRKEVNRRARRRDDALLASTSPEHISHPPSYRIGRTSPPGLLNQVARSRLFIPSP